MEARRFVRHPQGDVTLDLCWDCHGLWFDEFESTALAARSVIELFRLIHEHRDKPARPLATSMACPLCRVRLVFTQDLQRTNRFNYYRCGTCHGRFTTFFQFLREKQFVRSLSPVEVASLKAKVAQVRCSSCGGAIDLARDPACRYCGSPISVLDAEAVDKALAALEAAERPRAVPEPDRLAEAFRAMVAAQAEPRRESIWTRDINQMQTTPLLVDLVAEGISRLFR
jgi:Zn-finger nucleic acid-binding protein